MVTWKSASTSSRNASKASSVRSSSSISSTGAPATSGSSACSSGRLIRNFREHVVRQPLAVDPALGLGEPYRDHLGGVVPFIDGRRDIEALVALQRISRRPSVVDSTLAISVLPTPASPSRKIGRPCAAPGTARWRASDRRGSRPSEER